MHTEGVTHKTVLLQEAVDALALKPNSVVVDATGGGGGHSRRILELLGKEGVLVIVDADPESVVRIQKSMGAHQATVHVSVGNFRNIKTVLSSLNIHSVDAILADLGWNSDQFSMGGKGFSFQKDEPLLMTYGDPKTYSFTARDIVNDWSEETIRDMLIGYADERFARQIARSIVEVRTKKPIETTGALVEAVVSGVPARFRHGKINPATKTFQALRIAVNDEYDALREFLDQGQVVLNRGGRIAVISFHSGEDRIVKRFFKEKAEEGEMFIHTKKPVTPSQKEIVENSRARSAVLRIAEKL